MRLRRITPKVTILDFRDSKFLFYDDEVLAIQSGGFIYTFKEMRTGAETKAMDWFANGDGTTVYPVARIGENEFRFIEGSTLSKEGLPLTRLEAKR